MAKKPTKSKESPKQKELIIVMILSLLLGGAGGFAVGAVTNSDDSNTIKSTQPTHEHSMFMVESSEAPTVELMVTEDKKSGYNVKLMTTNFAFAPENVNGENVVGEGHAHLYVDGEKVGRLYGPNFHYDGSFEGTKTFRATLNANDHSEYAVDGDVIDTEIDVTHDSSDPDHSDSHSGHSHDSMEKGDDTMRIDSE